MDRPAIFLDRDGTLNELALNPQNGEWESPHSPEDTSLVVDLAPALELLKTTGLPIFVVSNQPSAAKGKCNFEALKAVHEVVLSAVKLAGVEVQEWFYCYHHPEGVVEALTLKCECRKPGTLFLRQAAEKHGLDLQRSWFIGDQDFDIRCGRDAGCKTVVIENPRSAKKRVKEKADHNVSSLLAAAKIVAAS